MEGIICCQRILTCIDVSRKITEVIFKVDLLRCVNIRDCITCLRKVNVLLKNVTLNSSYISEVINNCNVQKVVMSLSVFSVNRSSRFWCNRAPVNRGVGET